MSGTGTLERAAAAPAEDESAKRRQIIDGARAVFLAQGFDAASMNDIARAAGVSKGTLYVYFKHKEELFEAIVEQECDAQAEGIFDLDPERSRRRSRADAARRCLRQISVPAGKSLGDPHRDRHRRPYAGDRPQVLRERARPAASRSSRPISRHRSRPACLVVEDCEIAAAQFMESSQAMLFKPMVFNFAPAPSLEQIERVVRIAVKTFLAAYRASAKRSTPSLR